MRLVYGLIGLESCGFFEFTPLFLTRRNHGNDRRRGERDHVVVDSGRFQRLDFFNRV